MNSVIRVILLLTLNAAVWTLNALLLRGTIQLSAKSKVPLTIETHPERVRLLVNQNIWTTKDSTQGWVQTPTTVHLPEGQHKITLQRPGYASHTFRVLLMAGRPAEVASELEQIAESVMEVEFTSTDDLKDSMTMVIDEGLAQGSAPLKIIDLTPGPHMLEVTWTPPEGNQRLTARCTFTIQASENSKPLQIHIVRAGKRLKIPGCKRATP